MVCFENTTAIPIKFAQNAAKFATKELDVLLDDSRLHSVGKCPFERLSSNDIIVDRLLGRGGFCDVHECSKLSDQRTKFAIKLVSEPKEGKMKNFILGTSDLVLEAHFLAALSHPNILNLHGVSDKIPFDKPSALSFEDSLSQGKHGDIFIVLEKIEETLKQRIKKWMIKSDRTKGFLYRATRDSSGCHRKNFLIERVRVASQLASAMEYLHKKNVVFRDLKPDNIGLDASGSVKIFDFGLAKELKRKDYNSDGTYNLTGKTGTIRYMAPEVALGKAYNASADVYSFSIILWELCSLKAPFVGFNEQAYMEQVFQKGFRPKIPTLKYSGSYGHSLKKIVESCWDQDASKRPCFNDISVQLSILQGTVESKDLCNKKPNVCCEDHKIFDISCHTNEVEVVNNDPLQIIRTRTDDTHLSASSDY